jgi:hypothetical protein
VGVCCSSTAEAGLSPVFVWYAATAVATVWFVFRDPRFDYRLLIVGAVLPLGDAVTGGGWVMHSLLFSIALFVVVLVATIGRRGWRRRFLPLPIGTLLHLVFGGAWTDSDLFWWPFSGLTIDDPPLPELDRGWGWTIAVEAAGVLLAAWIWRTARLADPARRQRFATTGQLDFVVH